MCTFRIFMLLESSSCALATTTPPTHLLRTTSDCPMTGLHNSSLLLSRPARVFHVSISLFFFFSLSINLLFHWYWISHLFVYTITSKLPFSSLSSSGSRTYAILSTLRTVVFTWWEYNFFLFVNLARLISDGPWRLGVRYSFFTKYEKSGKIGLGLVTMATRVIAITVNNKKTDHMLWL